MTWHVYTDINVRIYISFGSCLSELLFNGSSMPSTGFLLTCQGERFVSADLSSSQNDNRIDRTTFRLLQKIGTKIDKSYHIFLSS